ncbi:hypothetical protein ABEB22_12495 [Thioclava sp. 'Guangxiensis']|uniref:hypothetical protein n=1 Tax=Thioclava sp. 'Guangxiensis' TaxID=3149044 RepID=UPI003877F8B8
MNFAYGKRCISLEFACSACEPVRAHLQDDLMSWIIDCQQLANDSYRVDLPQDFNLLFGSIVLLGPDFRQSVGYDIKFVEYELSKVGKIRHWLNHYRKKSPALIEEAWVIKMLLNRCLPFTMEYLYMKRELNEVVAQLGGDFLNLE